MATRLLIVPGLNDSGPAHWQSWLHAQHTDAVRVIQRDWPRPDLHAWADAIDRQLEAAGGDDWIAVAHSFGCLALLRHASRQSNTPIRSILLVGLPSPTSSTSSPSCRNGAAWPTPRSSAAATIHG